MTNTPTEPVICKTAARVTKGADDTPEVGTFEVILSTPSPDRDGEEVKAEEWQQPLPDHITFDVDHGMSVASTVGSGVPRLDDDGRLLVKGRWASTDLAQQTRALVNEGHIRTVSVAFLRLGGDDENGAAKRELLNGAFVSVPANAEALILNSKSLQDQLSEPPAEEEPSSDPAEEPEEEPDEEPTPTDPEGSESASEDADPAADAAGSASDDAEEQPLDADAISEAKAKAMANSNLLAVAFGQ